MSSPIHIDIPNLRADLGMFTGVTFPSDFEALLQFKNIDVVNYKFLGEDIPQTFAHLEIKEISQSVDLDSRQVLLPMCHSYLQTTASRYFFSSIKDTLIYKEQPFWFKFYSLTDTELPPSYLYA